MKVLSALFSRKTKRTRQRILYLVLSASMLTCLVPGTVSAGETVYEFGGDMVITENQYDPGQLERAILPYKVAYNEWKDDAVQHKVTDLAYLPAIRDEKNVVYVELWKLCEELDLICTGDYSGYTIKPADFYMHKKLYFPYDSGGFSYSMFKKSVTLSNAPGLLRINKEEYVPAELVLFLMDCEYLFLPESAEEEAEWCLVISKPCMSVYDVLTELTDNIEVYDFKYSEDFGITNEELAKNMNQAEIMSAAYDLIGFKSAAMADAFANSLDLLPFYDAPDTTWKDYEWMQDILTLVMQADEEELKAVQEKNSPVFWHLFDATTNGVDAAATDTISYLYSNLNNIFYNTKAYIPAHGKWQQVPLELRKAETVQYLEKMKTGLTALQVVALAANTCLDISEAIRVFSSRDETSQTAVGAFLDHLYEIQNEPDQDSDDFSYIAADEKLLEALNRQYNGLIINTKRWAVGESLSDNLGSIIGSTLEIFSLEMSIIMGGYRIGADVVNYISGGAVDAGKAMATSYFGLLYEADARSYFEQELREIPQSYKQEDVTATLYAAYNYLKSAYVTRNLGLEGCKFYTGYEKVKQQSDAVNKRIATMLAILADAAGEGQGYGAVAEDAAMWVQELETNEFYQICQPLSKWFYAWLQNGRVPEEGVAADGGSAFENDHFRSALSDYSGLRSAVVCDMDNDTWPEMITVSGEQNSYLYGYVLRVYGIDHDTLEVSLWDEAETDAYIESNYNEGSMSAHIQSSEGVPYTITYSNMENHDAMTWSYIHKSVYRLEDRQLKDVTTDTEKLGGTSGVSLFRADNADTMLCEMYVEWDFAESEDYTKLAEYLEDPSASEYYDITAIDLEKYYDENVFDADPLSLLVDDIQAVVGPCTNDSTTDDGISMTSRYLAENGCTVQIVTDMESGQIHSVMISDEKLYGLDEFLWAKDEFLSNEASDVMKLMYQTVLSSKALAISDEDRAMLDSFSLQADEFTDRDQNVFYGTHHEDFSGCSATFQRVVYVVGAESCDSMVTIEVPVADAAQSEIGK